VTPKRAKEISLLSATCLSSVSEETPEGLILLENFISSENEELSLLEQLDRIPWGSPIGRRVKHFGFRFDYKTKNVVVSDSLKKSSEVCLDNCDVPPIPEFCKLLIARLSKESLSLSNTRQNKFSKPFENFVREVGLVSGMETPLIDQITVNEYLPGQGIAPHVDTHSAFEDVIFSLSLGSQCVMCFSHALYPEKRKFYVLPRRSLLILSGEARLVWTHGISYRKTDWINGKRSERGRRISITFRKVRSSGSCQCEFPRVCDSQQSQSL